MSVQTVEIAKEPKVIVPSQIVQLRKQDGRRIIQMWLADSSFTFNGRRLNKEALPNIAKTAEGKKYLIPPTLEHPQRSTTYPNDLQRDLQSINEAAKPFEAGTVIGIERQNRYGIDGYDAFIDLDTKIGRDLFDSGMLPRYSSTSIYKLDARESEDNITKALINNICAVKYPNYGIRASLQGMCVGDVDGCKEQLINNSVTVSTSANDGQIVTLTQPCPTMKAVSELDDDNKIVFNNTLFMDKELQSSVNNMSANPNVGTTDSTVEYSFPKSGRKLILDGKGQIISDSHPKDAIPDQVKKNMPPGMHSEKPSGSGEGNGDNNDGDNNGNGEGENKDAKVDGGRKVKVDDNNKSKETETETTKTEEVTKTKTEEKPEENKEAKLDSQNQNQNQNSEIERVKTDLKREHDKEMTKAIDAAKFYKRELIKSKLAQIPMKDEVKSEHMKKWADSELSMEDLAWHLELAYGQNSQLAKASQTDRERKNSAFDADADYEVKNSNPRDDKKHKLTFDMLQKGR
jgi:hypothetical protein